MKRLLKREMICLINMIIRFSFIIRVRLSFSMFN